MDKTKAQSYLDKINESFINLPARPHEIDVDSLLGFIRIFYSSVKEMAPAGYHLNESNIQYTREKNVIQPIPTQQEEVAEVEPSPQNSVNIDPIPLETDNTYSEILDDQVSEKTEPIAAVDTESSVVEKESDNINIENIITEAVSEEETTIELQEEAEILVIERNKQEAPPAVDLNQVASQEEEQTVTSKEVEVTEPDTVPELVMAEHVIEEPEPVLDLPAVKPQEIETTYDSGRTGSETSAAIESLFAEKGPTGLVDFLGLSPLDNLNKAWGLNERMLVIKDLFNNDLKVFEDTVQMLNKLSTFNEAKAYLSDHVVKQYEWFDLSKTKKAVDFIKHVRRLFAKA